MLSTDAGRPSCASLQEQQQQQQRSSFKERDVEQQSRHSSGTYSEEDEDQEANGNGLWQWSFRRRRSLPMASIGDCIVTLASAPSALPVQQQAGGDPSRHQWPTDSWWGAIAGEPSWLTYMSLPQVPLQDHYSFIYNRHSIYHIHFNRTAAHNP